MGLKDIRDEKCFIELPKIKKRLIKCSVSVTEMESCLQRVFVNKLNNKEAGEHEVLLNVNNKEGDYLTCNELL